MLNKRYCSIVFYENRLKHLVFSAASISNQKLSYRTDGSHLRSLRR